MKKLLIYLAFVLVLNQAYSQTQQASQQSNVKSTVVKSPIITFDNTIQDFGIIPYNGSGKHIFVVTNTGTEPLIIYNCIKGCGCTQVDWTKTPIMPGQKGFVLATYNTKKIGEFNRGVDVYSNDTNRPKINIRLKGSVEVVPGGETPPIVVEDKKRDTTKNKEDTKW